MGLFDRFRSKPAPPPAPPEPGAQAAPFELPASGTIATFDAADAVGTIPVPGQAGLRFGRSACQGFEPVVGTRVLVGRAQPHPLGGFRALDISIDPADAGYDQRLEARDRTLGLAPPQDPLIGAAAASNTLGWAIVLLDHCPPSGPQAFKAWAEKLGLAQKLRIQVDGGVRLGAGAHDAISYVGSGPFPDLSPYSERLPPDFDPGKGFIGVSLGLPGMMAMNRKVLAGLPDPWGPQGPLRDLSRIIRELLAHGRAVLLPQAAGMALVREKFVERLEDLDALDEKPFRAWIDCSLDPARRLYATFGLKLHGLPDVELAVDPDSDWDLDRALEALMAATHRMVHLNRPLDPGERIEVPIGVQVGAGEWGPVDGDVETYEAQAPRSAEVTDLLGNDRMPLRRVDRPPVLAGWREGRLALNTYAELMRSRVRVSRRARMISLMTPRVTDGRPPFTVDVWALAEGGYLMQTNGLGRVAQPGGAEPVGTARVELAAVMAAHHPLIASVLATVGQQIHPHAPEDVFKPCDTIALEVPELAAAGFVLGDAGALELAEGPRVHLLELIPASAAEYARVRQMGTRPWLAQLGPMDPTQRASRWKLMLA